MPQGGRADNRHGDYDFREFSAYSTYTLIPETEVWIKREERPGFVFRNLSGAKIDFVIIHVDRKAGFA